MLLKEVLIIMYLPV